MYVLEAFVTPCLECNALTTVDCLTQHGSEWPNHKAERNDCDCGYVYIRILDSSFERTPGEHAVLKGKGIRTELTIEQEEEVLKWLTVWWLSACRITEEQLGKLSEEMLELKLPPLK